MQFRKIFHFLTLCSLILICPQISDAQRIAKNKNGERIVIFPNGSWEYFDSGNTTHNTILKNYINNNQKEEIIDEQTAKGVSAEILKYEKKLDLAQEELDYTMDKESDAKYSKEILEEELAQLKSDKKTDTKKYKAVEGQLYMAVKMEKAARKDRKSASRKLKRLQKNKGIKTDSKTKVVKAPKTKKQKTQKESVSKKKNSKTKVAKVKTPKKKTTVNKKSQSQVEVAKTTTNQESKKGITKYSGSKKRTPEDEAETTMVDTQRSAITYQEDATFYAASKRFKQYRMEEDVMYNPPMKDCNLAFDGVDKFLGKKRKDVEREVFFIHTDEEMKQYMLEDDYITCEGSITQITGGVLLLNLFYSITTTDAKRAFGRVGKGSLISIKMIDGTKVSLVNNKSESGSFDPLTRKHTYTLQYLINSGQEKILRKGEVDLVRMIWETGYEDYEVHNLDFFIDQFRCLNKK